MFVTTVAAIKSSKCSRQLPKFDSPGGSENSSSATGAHDAQNQHSGRIKRPVVWSRAGEDGDNALELKVATTRSSSASGHGEKFCSAERRLAAAYTDLRCHAPCLACRIRPQWRCDAPALDKRATKDHSVDRKPAYNCIWEKPPAVCM